MLRRCAPLRHSCSTLAEQYPSGDLRTSIHKKHGRRPAPAHAIEWGRTRPLWKSDCATRAWRSVFASVHGGPQTDPPSGSPLADPLQQTPPQNSSHLRRLRRNPRKGQRRRHQEGCEENREVEAERDCGARPNRGLALRCTALSGLHRSDTDQACLAGH